MLMLPNITKGKDLLTWEMPHPEDPGIEVQLEINARRWACLVVWSVQNSNDELAGWGVIKRGEVAWLCLSDYGNMGGVMRPAETMAWAQEQALNAGHLFLNLQWHTHPTSCAAWSLRDLKDQCNIVETAARFNAAGEMYFLLLDPYFLAAIVRVYVWDKTRGIRYNEGPITLAASEDTKADLPTQTHQYWNWHDLLLTDPQMQLKLDDEIAVDIQHIESLASGSPQDAVDYLDLVLEVNGAWHYHDVVSKLSPDVRKQLNLEGDYGYYEHLDFF